jgi:hypothetical protein
MKLRCIRNGILFAFLQGANSKGYFEEKTKWGFTIAADDNGQGVGNDAFTRSIEKGRWAKVLVIGNECEEVKVGDYVCLEPNMWTNSFTHDGIAIRKSDESKIMIISEEKPDVRI